MDIPEFVSEKPSSEASKPKSTWVNVRICVHIKATLEEKGPRLGPSSIRFARSRPREDDDEDTEALF